MPLMEYIDRETESSIIQYVGIFVLLLGPIWIVKIIFFSHFNFTFEIVGAFACIAVGLLLMGRKKVSSEVKNIAFGMTKK